MNDLILKRINGKDIKNNFKKNKYYIFIYLIIIFSFFIGVLVFKNESNFINSYLNNLIYNYLTFKSKNFFGVFLNSFCSSIFYLIIIFALGTSAFGCVFVPAVLFFKALGYGALSGYLYSVYQLKGVCFYIISILPGAIIFLSCLVFAAKESFTFSLIFFNFLRDKYKDNNLFSDFKLYLLRFLILFSVMLVSNLTDTVTEKVFLSFFSL